MTITSDYRCVEKSFVIGWRDEDNREGIRKDFSVTLKRDDNCYGTEEKLSTGASTEALDNNFVTVTKENSVWTIKYDLLPKYKSGVTSLDGNESVYSFDGSAIPEGYNRYDFRVDGDISSVEYRYQPMRGSVNTTMEFAGDDGWEEITRPGKDMSFYVSLEYRIGTSGEWCSINKENLVEVNGKYFGTEGVYTTSEPLQVINYTNTMSYSSALWVDLPVYVNTAEDENANGSQKVYYRIVGNIDVDYDKNNYVNSWCSDKVKIGDNGITMSNNTQIATTFIETLDYTSLQIKEEWTKNGKTGSDSTLSSDEIEKLIELNVIPKTVNAVIRYKIDGTEDHSNWAVIPNIPNSGTATLNMTDIINGKIIDDIKLPKADKDGNIITYQIYEKSVTYANNVTKDVSWDTDYNCGHIDSLDVYSINTEGNELDSTTQLTLSNNISVGSLSVTNSWADENNNDGGRRDITVQLYKDSTAIGNAQTLNADNNWTYTWTELPIYSDAAQQDDDHKHVYTVKELSGSTGTEAVENNGVFKGANGTEYNVTYSDGVKLDTVTPAQLTITNTHATEKGSISIENTWDDEGNKRGLRPESVSFTLYWTDAAEIDDSTIWTKVEKSNEDENSANVGVYSDKANPQTIMSTSTGTGGEKAVWTGLPVYSNGKAITYKVVQAAPEIYDFPIYTKAKGGVETVNANLTKIANKKETALYITNKLSTTCLTINNTWADDDDWAGLVRPSEIVYKVEYIGRDGNSLALTSKDSKVVEGLVTQTCTEDSKWEAVTISGIPWKDNDKEYTYRVSVIRIKYEDGTVVNSQNAAFSNDGNTWEGRVGAYNGKVTTLQNPTTRFWTANVNNTLPNGDLNVNKIWKDGNNRDGHRSSVKLQLYRDGKAFGDVITVSEGGNANTWNASWDKLPIYRADSSAESEYYVLEEEVTGYTALYKTDAEGSTEEMNAADAKIKLTQNGDVELQIINTREPELISVNAKAIWKDYSKHFRRNPSSVNLILQWSLNKNAADDEWENVNHVESVPATADDNGTDVFTTSDVTQFLSGTDKTRADAEWKNVPKYRQGQEIYYRAVETTINGIFRLDSSILNNKEIQYKINANRNEDGSYNLDGLAEVEISFITDGRNVPDDISASDGSELNYSVNPLKIKYGNSSRDSVVTKTFVIPTISLADKTIKIGESFKASLLVYREVSDFAVYDSNSVIDASEIKDDYDEYTVYYGDVVYVEYKDAPGVKIAGNNINGVNYKGKIAKITINDKATKDAIAVKPNETYKPVFKLNNERYEAGGKISLNPAKAYNVSLEYKGKAETAEITIKDKSGRVIKTLEDPNTLQAKNYAGMSIVIEGKMTNYPDVIAKYTAVIGGNLSKVTLNGKANGTVIKQALGSRVQYKLAYYPATIDWSDVEVTVDGCDLEYDTDKHIFAISNNNLSAEQATVKFKYLDITKEFTIMFDKSAIVNSKPKVSLVSSTDTELNIAITCPKGLVGSKYQYKIHGTAISYNIDVWLVAGAVEGKVFTLKNASTKEPAYATKFSLAGKNTNLYRNSSSEVLLAEAKFDAATTFTELTGVEISSDMIGARIDGKNIYITSIDRDTPLGKYTATVTAKGNNSLPVTKTITFTVNDNVAIALFDVCTSKIYYSGKKNVTVKTIPTVYGISGKIIKPKTVEYWLADNNGNPVNIADIKIDKKGNITIYKSYKAPSNIDDRTFKAVAKITMPSGKQITKESTFVITSDPDRIEYVRVIDSSSNDITNQLNEAVTTDVLYGAQIVAYDKKGKQIENVSYKVGGASVEIDKEGVIRGFSKTGNSTVTVTTLDGDNSKIKIALKTKYYEPENGFILKTDENTVYSKDGINNLDKVNIGELVLSFKKDEKTYTVGEKNAPLVNVSMILNKIKQAKNLSVFYAEGTEKENLKYYVMTANDGSITLKYGKRTDIYLLHLSKVDKDSLELKTSTVTTYAGSNDKLIFEVEDKNSLSGAEVGNISISPNMLEADKGSMTNTVSYFNVVEAACFKLEEGKIVFSKGDNFCSVVPGTYKANIEVKKNNEYLFAPTPVTIKVLATPKPVVNINSKYTVKADDQKINIVSTRETNCNTDGAWVLSDIYNDNIKGKINDFTKYFIIKIVDGKYCLVLKDAYAENGIGYIPVADRTGYIKYYAVDFNGNKHYNTVKITISVK